MASDDVSVKFTADGVDSVLSAFRSVEQAAVAAERRRSAEAIKEQRVRAGLAKIEADQQIAQAKRAAAEIEAARKKAEAPRNVFGDIRRSNFADRGLREFSSSMAFEQIFGRTAAQIMGLHGAAGQVVGVFRTLQSGISLAADALTQFGGYLLKDIIGPQLELGTKAQQLANRMGGGATGAGVQDKINALYAANPQADLKEITKVFETAADTTKDATKANVVAQVALQAQKAYGYDPTKTAADLGKKAAAMGDLPEDALRNVLSSTVVASKLGTLGPGAFGGAEGKTQTMLTRLVGGGGAGNEIAIANLLNAATKKGASAATVTSGLDRLIEDIARDKNRPAFKGAVTAQGVDLAKAISSIVSTTGGDLMKLGAGPKAGNLASVQIGALNKGSLDFLRNLGVDQVYKDAGGGEAGAKAVTDMLTKILSPAEGAAQLAEDAKKSEATTGMELEAAFRQFKVTLMTSLLPVIQEQGPKIADALKSIAEGLSTNGDAIGEVFTTITKVLAGIMYGLLTIMPDSIAAKFGGNKAKNVLGKFAGVLDEGADAGSDAQAKIDADKKLHPEKYAVPLASQLLSGSFSFGGKGGSTTLAGGSGGFAGAGVAEMLLSKPASEGGMSNVQGPPTAAYAKANAAAADGKAFGDAAANAFVAQVSKVDPARLVGGLAPKPTQ